MRLSPTRIGPDVRALETRDIGRREDAALADDDAVFRHARRESFGRRQRRLEGFEVAIVDADEAAIEAQRAVQLRRVVHLDDGIHAPVLGGAGEIGRERIVHFSHDDEDAIRAPGPRLDHLVGVDHEVLAQHGQRDRRTGVGEEFRRALERRRIGENREAGRPTRLIGLGERDGFEICSDEPLGGRGLLDLGDERWLPRCKLGFDGARKGSDAGRAARILRHDLQRVLCHRGGHFLALVARDFLENIGHGGSLNETGSRIR